MILWGRDLVHSENNIVSWVWVKNDLIYRYGLLNWGISFTYKLLYEMNLRVFLVKQSCVVQEDMSLNLYFAIQLLMTYAFNVFCIFEPVVC